MSANPNTFSFSKADRIAKSLADMVDRYILTEIDDPILATIDNILKLRASLSGIRSESYKESQPFRSNAPAWNAVSWTLQRPVKFNAKARLTGPYSSI